MKRMYSVLTDDLDHCMFTGSAMVERHHVFGGSCRDASERRGFVAPLRPDLHPNGAHFVRTPENIKIDQYLKQRCQRYYEDHYGTRDDFRKEFAKSYL